MNNQTVFRGPWSRVSKVLNIPLRTRAGVIWLLLPFRQILLEFDQRISVIA